MGWGLGKRMNRGKEVRKGRSVEATEDRDGGQRRSPQLFRCRSRNETGRLDLGESRKKITSEVVCLGF